MKKKALLVFVTMMGLIFNLSLSAQDGKIANKLFYSELGGPGVIMSANFDSRIKPNERLGFGFRLGVGFGIGKVKTTWVDEKWNYTYTEKLTRSYYSFPVGLNYVFGNPDSSNSFEVGAGVSFLTQEVTLYCYDVKKAGNMIGYLNLMNRRTPINGGFSFRIGCTPIIGTSGDLCPMAAVAFGYAF